MSPEFHRIPLLGAASRLGARAEIVGGLVLLAIGVKILAEHGVF